MSYASELRKREKRFVGTRPGKGLGYGGPSPRLKRYQGVRVGGKRVTRFSQIKTRPAGKIGPRGRTKRGIALAIL